MFPTNGIDLMICWFFETSLVQPLSTTNIVVGIDVCYFVVVDTIR